NVVELRRKLEALQLPALDGADQRAGAGDGLDEADVLGGDGVDGDEVVARLVDGVLGRWQIAQRPALLTESGEANAAMVRVVVADRQREVARELLGAGDDREHDDVALVRVEHPLHEVEAAGRAVDALAVEKADELVEVGAERNAGVENEAPRLVEIGARDVR